MIRIKGRRRTIEVDGSALADGLELVVSLAVPSALEAVRLRGLHGRLMSLLLPEGTVALEHGDATTAAAIMGAIGTLSELPPDVPDLLDTTAALVAPCILDVRGRQGEDELQPVGWTDGRVWTDLSADERVALVVWAPDVLLMPVVPYLYEGATSAALGKRGRRVVAPGGVGRTRTFSGGPPGSPPSGGSPTGAE